ncbi:MAG: hypothetical protein AABY79_00295 [Nitrospirota bacterium]
MKFLADMGISQNTVAFLRNKGHDAAMQHIYVMKIFRGFQIKILLKRLWQKNGSF